VPTLTGNGKQQGLSLKIRSVGSRIISKISSQPQSTELESTEEKFLAAAGLTRIGNFDAKDVFIAGYPKSGNTWLQNIVCELIYGLDTTIAPDRLIQQLAIDVTYRPYYSRVGTPMFFKTHYLPRPEYRHVIYLVRDGRDAMVSYFHHIKAVNRLKELDTMDVVRNGTYLFPCKWHEHVEQWLTNPYNAQMIILKYEDIKADPLAALKQFCTFVGVERDTSYLEQVVRRTSFEEMKKKEATQGWDTLKWPKDQAFVRRGTVGSFRDEMPQDVLDEFLSQAESTLRKVGYSVS